MFTKTRLMQVSFLYFVEDLRLHILGAAFQMLSWQMKERPHQVRRPLDDLFLDIWISVMII